MILGIDPGCEKFGWALTDDYGQPIATGIAETEHAEAFFQAIRNGDNSVLAKTLLEGVLPEKMLIRRCICGNGTAHKKFLGIITDCGVSVELSDERNTTLEARALFWRLHPPRGIRRIVPLSLQVPPRCVDDLAACRIVAHALHEE